MVRVLSSMDSVPSRVLQLWRLRTNSALKSMSHIAYHIFCSGIRINGILVFKVIGTAAEQPHQCLVDGAWQWSHRNTPLPMMHYVEHTLGGKIIPVSQKMDTLVLPITLPNVDQFSKFFLRWTQQ